MTLKVTDHLTGEEHVLDNEDELQLLLEGNKKIKPGTPGYDAKIADGLTEWHKKRNQRLHLSIEEDGVLVSRMLDGKKIAVTKPVDNKALAGAGAALEDKVADLSSQVQTLGGTVAHLSQALDNVGSRIGALETKAAKPAS